MKAVYLILVLSLRVMTPCAHALKLWKWVDKDGNTHYSESKPPSQATKIEEKQINPDQNVIHADITPPVSSTSSGTSSSDMDEDPENRSDNKTQKGLAAGGGAVAKVPEPSIPPAAPATAAPPAAPAAPAAPAPPAASAVPAPVAH